MYEPFLMITTLVDDRARLDREIERRRAVLERLDAQSTPRRGWFARLRRTRSAVPGAAETVLDVSATASRVRTADRAAAAPGVRMPDQPASEPGIAPRTGRDAGCADAGLLAAPVR